MISPLKTLLLPAEDAAAIRKAADLIRCGELVAFPTETVYGLGASALNEDACRRIYLAKGRPSDNPLIAHVADFSGAAVLTGTLPPEAEELCRLFWPGPLTLILPKGDAVPDTVTAGLSTVAVRCPDHPAALALIRAAGVPIAAPSANRSGRPSPTCASHVMEDFDGRIPLILDGGPCRVGVESTILDLTVSPPALLRPGGIPLEELTAVIGPIVHEGRLVGSSETPKAPGMKYRHYAPKAPLTVCSGSPALTARAIVDLAQPGDGILIFDEYRELCPPGVTPLSFGSCYRPEEHASRLFAALRRFDDGDFPHLFASCPPNEKGLDRAVINRLKKASGGQWLRYPETFILGLTGRSGTGKSTVSAFLRQKGAEFIDCDALYHRLLSEDAELKQKLSLRFGPDILVNGIPSTKELGKQVFSDPAALADLNEIAFSAVNRALPALIAEAEMRRVPLLVLDAPTLFEAGADRFCTATAAVLSDEESCIRRIVERDGISPEYARSRLKNQPSDEFFRRHADFILENRGGEEQLLFSAARLYDTLLAKEDSHGIK